MSIVEQAKQIYESRLKAELEPNHHGHFVAIEPISEQYFVRERSVEAALAAKRAFPERAFLTLRIGYDATFHIGAYTS